MVPLTVMPLPAVRKGQVLSPVASLALAQPSSLSELLWCSRLVPRDQ